MEPLMVAYLDRAVVGTTRAELSIVPLRRLKVSVAPLPEQELIARAATGADKEIKIQQTNLAKLRQLKSALMQDLLTGRVPADAIELD
ncbi:MAG: hypothetical protein R3F19_33290 [Verrucomicrobiales bacterium]